MSPTAGQDVESLHVRRPAGRCLEPKMPPDAGPDVCGDGRGWHRVQPVHLSRIERSAVASFWRHLPSREGPTSRASLARAASTRALRALQLRDFACYVAPRVSPGTVDRGRRSTPVLGGGGPLTSRSRCRAQGSFSNISPHAAVSRRAGTFDVVVFSDVLSVLAEPGLRLLVAIPTR